MGNQPSSTNALSSSSSSKGTGSRTSKVPQRGAEAVERVKQVVGEVQEEIKKSVKKLDDDHPAAQFLDSVCGGGYFEFGVDGEGESQASSRYHRKKYGKDYYSEDAYGSEDESRTMSEDDTTAYTDDRSRRSRADKSVESQSYMSQSDYDSDHRHKQRGRGRRNDNSFDTEEDTRTEASSAVGNPTTSTALQAKLPLASSFAKRCYFTKAGIGRTTQHYEGLTLTGNVVLMLASAMKLKGCPTICDEDLRRVEQTYPNQFSRLPDELLLSSGWRRISKYCHFSNKAIPDGVPFFHSKQRLHPSGGYYFLLASAVGMTRPLDVEPLSRDTLVLLETDYPTQCDSAPSVLMKDYEQWTLVNKFCFFSGGPINTEEDVYYQADFDGNQIFMLAFLSPSLTPEELYKLAETGESPTLKTIQGVHEVESVYDLTERDFDDLKLYHLGPCRALPQYILQPQEWIKILPPHFLAARQQATIRAENYMQRHGIPIPMPEQQLQGFGNANGNGNGSEVNMNMDPQHNTNMTYPDPQTPVPYGGGAQQPHYFDEDGVGHDEHGHPLSPGSAAEFRREIEEEGAFHDDSIPMDEAHGPAFHGEGMVYADPATPKLDPPDDEPPSLHKASMELLEQGSVPEENMASPQRAFPDEQQFHQEPMSPDDEQQSTNLISLGSPDEQPNPHYDPFAAPSAFPQNEFGGMVQPPEEEADPSKHYRPPPAVRTLDPLYTAGSPSQHEQMEDSQHDPNYHYGGEEKKVGLDEQHEMMMMVEEQEQQQAQFQYNDDPHNMMRNGEEDFIPIKRDGYSLGDGAAAASPHSMSSDNSHQSAAFRSAQELLRKNRRRRMEKTRSQQPGDPPEFTSEAMATTPMGVDEPSTGTWEEGSEISGSNVSGSSLWSEGSGTAGDRSSRRALILQMAKARMKNNKDSPTKSAIASPNRGMEAPPAMIEEEEGASLGGQTEAKSEANTDIDFAGDLD